MEVTPPTEDRSISRRRERQVAFLASDPNYAKKFAAFCKQREIEVSKVMRDGERFKKLLDSKFFPVAIVNVSCLEDPYEYLQNIRSMADDTQIIVISENNNHDVMYKLINPPNPLAEASLGGVDEFQQRDLYNLVQSMIDDWIDALPSIEVAFDDDIDQVLSNFSRSFSGVIRSPAKLSVERIKTELEVVIKKLFSGSGSQEPIAGKIDVETLRGSGKSASYLFKLTPKITLDTRLNKSAVLKFGPKAEVRTESHNYDKYVEWFLTVQQAIRKVGYEETSNFAGLLYSFPLDSQEGYDTFAEFIRSRDTSSVVSVLESLFSPDNKHWLAIDGSAFNHGLPNDMESYMIEHGLRTDRKHLVEQYEAMKEELVQIGLKGRGHLIRDAGERISFPTLDFSTVNPISCIKKPYSETIGLTLVHGDLHANNILIDESERCFFIDFYYTGFGHIFRDFIDLELSIRYDLFCSKQVPDDRRFVRRDSKDISDKNLRQLISFEKDLVKHARGEKHLREGSTTNRDSRLRKAYDLITKTRELAFRNFPGKESEYYLALAFLAIKALKYFFPLDVRLYRFIISGMYFEFVGEHFDHPDENE